jgi:transposase
MMSVQRRRVFHEDFKREAVEQVTGGGRPTSVVAAEFGIHETVLRRWMLRFPPLQTAKAPNNVQPMVSAEESASPDLATENRMLRSEIERLRADRQILKRALAIVFAEMPQ